jgi:hypothetical protein
LVACYGPRSLAVHPSYSNNHNRFVSRGSSLSKYAEDTEIICNYTAKDFDYKGTLVKPDGYILIESKK